MTDLLTPTIQVKDSKEVGASTLVMSYAKKMGMGELIDPEDIEFREEVLSLVAGRVLSPSARSLFENNPTFEAAWNFPLLEKTRYTTAIVSLLSKKESIEKALAGKHIKDGCAVLFTFPCQTEIAALLTNTEGCPLGIEVLSDSNEKMNDRLTGIIEKYALRSVVCIGIYSNVEEANLKQLKPYECTRKVLLEDLVLIQTGCGAISLDLPALYRQRTQMEKVFRNLFLDGQSEIIQVQAYLFLEMLSYYLHWHMKVKLDAYFQEVECKSPRYTLTTILEKLKSVRSQKIQFENTIEESVKNRLNAEQAEIFSIFEIDYHTALERVL